MQENPSNTEHDILLSHLESHYQCSICTQILFDPITLICQHTFCRDCLVQHMKTSKKCPTCQKHFFLPSTNTTFIIRDAIFDLQSKIYPPEKLATMQENRLHSRIKLNTKETVIAELRKELENTILDDINEIASTPIHNPYPHYSSHSSLATTIFDFVGSQAFLNASLAFAIVVLVPLSLFLRR